MSDIPLTPSVGDRWTAENGQQYEYSEKGTWRAVVGENSTLNVRYTTSATPPTSPELGDQWWDTLEQRLKTWTTNGEFRYWRTINAETIFEGSNVSPLIAERVLPLMWVYGEQNFAFEAWKTDAQYSWRDFDGVGVVRSVAGDDTLELETTTGLQLDGRYALVDATLGTTLATIDVTSILNDGRQIRTRVDLGLTLGPGIARLVRTNFDVRDGFARVKNGDVLFTKPLTNLKNTLPSLLRIRRSAEGTGVFTVVQRRPGTTPWLPTALVDILTPLAGYRDEVYSVDPGGPVEFAMSYRDTAGNGDRIEHMALYPTVQAVDNRRVDTPTNVTPADQEINVSTTPTLTGSVFRSLYNLRQNGAEFQVALDRNFTNVVLNSSSDFLASWVANTAPGAINDAVFADALNLVAVGEGGRIVRSADAGRTLGVVAPAGAITTALNGIDAVATSMVLCGANGVIQASINNGASWAAATAAGGYTGVFHGVALADKYGLVCGANGEIQRTVNNRGLIWAKAPVDNGYTGTFLEVTLLPNGRGIAVGTNGEIQTTSDYGATWRKRTQAAAYTGTWNGVHLGPDGRAVVVGTTGAIQTSDDFGATWTLRAAASGYVGAWQHVKLSGTNVIAVGSGGEIQTSTNSGITWSKRTTPGNATTTLLTVAFTTTGDVAVLMGNGVSYRPLKLEGAVNSYTVPAGENLLAISAVYWWRCRYQDAAGFWSEYSKPTVFATKNTLNAVNAPINLSPAKGAVNVSITPTFQASEFTVIGDNDAHNGSQWQISRGATFTTPVYDSGTVAATTSHTVPAASKLVDKETYSWRVRYRGASNSWGPWSVPTSFVATAKGNRPSITNLVENAARAVVLTTSAFVTPLAGDRLSATLYEVSTTEGFEASNIVRRGSVVAGATNTLELPANVTPTETVASLRPNTQYYFRVAHKGVQSEVSDWSDVAGLKTRKLPVVGEAVFLQPGTFTFTVPEDVTRISAVAVGAGGGSCCTSKHPQNNIAGGGGGGGGLTWKNDIEVTPGQTITIVVGAGGLGGDKVPLETSAATKEAAWGKTQGGSSSVGNFFSAGGGRSHIAAQGANWHLNTGGRGGRAMGGDGGGNGGLCAFPTPGVELTNAWAGGGGAGGYTGDGGHGGGRSYQYGSTATDGQGGGGGGGAHGVINTTDSNGGGGVGLYGQGASGAAGVEIGNLTGKGGSGGTDGQQGRGGNPSGAGGRYGGGRGHATGNGPVVVNGVLLYPLEPAAGMDGAVRIIWGPGRSFPSNAK